MRSFSKIMTTLVLSFSSLVANATPVFVGSWYVGDGPVWTGQPTVYSAREAAALLFGGVFSDYSISTISNDVTLINFMAHVDGYGDSQFLTSTVGQDFKVDGGAAGYNYNGSADYSAYVLDHSCSNRYGNPNEGCRQYVVGQNFAFRNDVPEPATIALLSLGLLGFAASRHRKQ